ncbi:HD domain-containing protein [Candidatus Latescibacterota bacterium]
MKKKQLEKIHNWLQSYSESFLSQSKKFRVSLVPRMNHITRVADNCRLLGEQLGWSKSDKNIIEALGLLHDVGRFSQYADFGTFDDKDSLQHSDRSFEVAEHSGILDGLKPETHRIMADGIRHHNTKKPPQDIHPDSWTFISLLRDADIIDKMHITLDLVVEHTQNGRLSMVSDGPLSSDIADSIRAGVKASKRHIDTTLDFFLFRLSAVFSMTWPEATRLLDERNSVADIGNHLPDEKAIRRLMTSMIHFIGEKSNVKNS